MYRGLRRGMAAARFASEEDEEGDGAAYRQAIAFTADLMAALAEAWDQVHKRHFGQEDEEMS